MVWIYQPPNLQPTDIRSRLRAFPGKVSRQKYGVAMDYVVIYAHFWDSQPTISRWPGHQYDNSIIVDWVRPSAPISREWKIIDCSHFPPRSGIFNTAHFYSVKMQLKPQMRRTHTFVYHYFNGPDLRIHCHNKIVPSCAANHPPNH
jgi:hypothetical protein